MDRSRHTGAPAQGEQPANHQMEPTRPTVYGEMSPRRAAHLKRYTDKRKTNLPLRLWQFARPLCGSRGGAGFEYFDLRRGDEGRASHLAATAARVICGRSVAFFEPRSCRAALDVHLTLIAVTNTRRRGVPFDGRYNIRLHLTAPRGLCSRFRPCRIACG